MHNTKFFSIVFVCALFVFSCGGKNDEIEATPDVNVEKENVEDSAFLKNLK